MAPMTEEQRAFYRVRYERRMQDPDYREKQRLKAKERYERKRASAEPKPRGRPRKYNYE